MYTVSKTAFLNFSKTQGDLVKQGLRKMRLKNFKYHNVRISERDHRISEIYLKTSFILICLKGMLPGIRPHPTRKAHSLCLLGKNRGAEGGRGPQEHSQWLSPTFCNNYKGVRIEFARETSSRAARSHSEAEEHGQLFLVLRPRLLSTSKA